MKAMNLAVAASAFAVAGLAHADYVGASIVNLGDLGSGANTYQVVIEFDSMDDQLIAVGGLPTVGPLSFQSSSPLMNEAGGVNGLSFEDTPFPGAAAWDSWLTVDGDTPGGDTQFSPGFAGGDGVASVVNGTSFSETDGGYFDSNPATVTGGTGTHVIAQFTLMGDFTYSGVVNWTDDTLPGGQFNSTAFSVTTVPAPGALALLGLAGLAAGRRRRG